MDLPFLESGSKLTCWSLSQKGFTKFAQRVLKKKKIMLSFFIAMFTLSAIHWNKKYVCLLRKMFPVLGWIPRSSFSSWCLSGALFPLTTGFPGSYFLLSFCSPLWVFRLKTLCLGLQSGEKTEGQLCRQALYHCPWMGYGKGSRKKFRYCSTWVTLMQHYLVSCIEI